MVGGIESSRLEAQARVFTMIQHEILVYYMVATIMLSILGRDAHILLILGQHNLSYHLHCLTF